jgi:signal transduction histidine kinase
MKKISIKLFISTFLALFVASSIPNIIQAITGDSLADRTEFQPLRFLIFFISFFGIVLLIFNHFMNQIVIKRLKRLNQATKEVMEGNYDSNLVDTKKDELSEVIHNFNSMTDALRSNEYLNKEFIRNFSHEIKTPLAAIKGYADLLKDESLKDSERLEYANIIAKESSRLSNLSRDMLMISFVDSHAILEQSDKFNISEQIRNILQLTQVQWEDKNIDLDLQLQDINVQSNKELLYHVWMNVISNAIKFSPENKTISIVAKQESDHVLIAISNTTKETVKVDNMFDLFFVGNKKDSNSSGIGLSLTKRIVEKLNGSITATVEENNLTILITI